MTDTVKQEFMRLVDLLPQTDPRTEAYHILLSSIERFDAIGSTINDMVDVVHSEAALDAVTTEAGWVKDQVGKVVELTAKIDPEKVPVHPIPTVPFEATDFPAEAEEKKPEPAPPTLSASDVRKLLVEVRGRGINVKAILQGFGVDSFQALPADKYDALAEALRSV